MFVARVQQNNNSSASARWCAFVRFHRMIARCALGNLDSKTSCRLFQIFIKFLGSNAVTVVLNVFHHSPPLCSAWCVLMVFLAIWILFLDGTYIENNRFDKRTAAALFFSSYSPIIIIIGSNSSGSIITVFISSWVAHLVPSRIIAVHVWVSGRERGKGSRSPCAHLERVWDGNCNGNTHHQPITPDAVLHKIQGLIHNTIHISKPHQTCNPSCFFFTRSFALYFALIIRFGAVVCVCYWPHRQSAKCSAVFIRYIAEYVRSQMNRIFCLLFLRYSPPLAMTFAAF